MCKGLVKGKSNYDAHDFSVVGERPKGRPRRRCMGESCRLPHNLLQLKLTEDGALEEIHWRIL